MEIKVCVLLIIIALAELMSLGDAAETDENNNELQDGSTSDSSPRQSVYNMDFMKGMFSFTVSRSLSIFKAGSTLMSLTGNSPFAINIIPSGGR